MTKPMDWIAVDWGTSNVRAWAMTGEDEIIAQAQSDQGMGRINAAQYPHVLESLVGQFPDPAQTPSDIIICGMAGAKQGWREAPYLSTPAKLDTLGQNAVIPPGLDDTRFNARILSGLCHKTTGEEDVIRGEETQILGYLAENSDFSGVICMPGTHSKWAVIEDGKVSKFTTTMTGELFEILSTHSVLKHSLASDEDKTVSDEGLTAGLQAGIDAPQRLTGNLFKVRAAALLADRDPAWCKGYLSGLLIGAEIAGHKEWIGNAPVPLIGSPALCKIYALGLEQIGETAFPIDATKATLAGLTAARKQIQ